MLPNRYHFSEAEPRIARLWAEADIYAYHADAAGPNFTIDTPPPTVSGQLHIGHCYSFTQADVIARYRRMRGDRVLYPMGFDDNGLATERFVEKTLGRKATEMGREAFIDACLALTQQTEDRFEMLWRRLGLGVDWHYRYSTISAEARRASQWSFILLHRAGLTYAQQAPTLWCPECRTAIAQAEVNDVLLPTQFSTIAFTLQDGGILPIATTRPELLPACVAIFVHPDDARYAHLIGQMASIDCGAREHGQTITVPILADELADPTKGSGAVMCCTFGDSTDVRWWHTHQLPLRAAIDRDGRMTELAGTYAGLTVLETRQRTLRYLKAKEAILSQETIEHAVGTHERCGTPVEYLHTRQWFIRVLDQKERLLEAGRSIRWYPEHMRIRYEHWVEHLQWDWCISRQRYFGVPFPAWMCRSCGATLLATLEQLPVDPQNTRPAQPCSCGSTDFEPEPDVMDTWATSSCTPMIIGRWPDDPDWFGRHFPLSMRPQAHDIIRTWAFYTIVKSLYHMNEIPWREIMVAGHGLSAERRKLSKSKEHSEIGPMELIEQESADALRYWATASRTGADSPLNMETIANGRRLVTKLWNASRFAENHLQDFTYQAEPGELLPTDRWLLSRLAETISKASKELDGYEHAAARAEVERFFWSDFCDNYLELVKSRLYGGPGQARYAAQWTLYSALLTVIKLLAPYLPYITEELYQGLFRRWEGAISVHSASWPEEQAQWRDAEAESFGEILLDLLRKVRRYKTERGLSVGTELATLYISMTSMHRSAMEMAQIDLRSATRAKRILVETDGERAFPALQGNDLLLEV
ncbi:MAG TPA: valine--tRNA ligase [Ktedonobacteraceae bacterium]|nr:valine--tRNA ligase [Ktedonobacteraceae bacterium]